MAFKTDRVSLSFLKKLILLKEKYFQWSGFRRISRIQGDSRFRGNDEILGKTPQNEQGFTQKGVLEGGRHPQQYCFQTNHIQETT